ncbi:MAG: hypothetical protein RL729_1169, partial [Actinomycetota bacterium]
MHGFDNDGVRFAHADSWAGAGSTHIVDRQEREAREHELLAPLATRSFGAGNRAVAEEEDPFRTCFDRD